MTTRTTRCGFCGKIVKTRSKGKNFIHCGMRQNISECELKKQQENKDDSDNINEKEKSKGLGFLGFVLTICGATTLYFLIKKKMNSQNTNYEKQNYWRH